jgi:hypothetical protein
MRRVRMAILLASLCAFLLTVVVPASAHQFTASRFTPLTEENPGKTRGKGIESEGLEAERNQKLVFGPFSIFCTAVTHANTVAEGAISWEEHNTLSTELKFNKCLTHVSFGAGFSGGLPTTFNMNPETKKAEPIKVVYHVNGFAEIGTGETESEVEIGSGDASFKIANKICNIIWPAQIVPTKGNEEGEFSEAAYSTNPVAVEPTANNLKKLPSGFQERLVITNLFKGMLWKLQEGQCAGEGGFEEKAKAEEGKTGVYKGALEIQMIGGNLGFE